MNHILHMFGLQKKFIASNNLKIMI